MSVTIDFKDTVAYDQEARASRDPTRLRWEIYTTKHTHYQAGGRK
jgi:hypothetical protein